MYIYSLLLMRLFLNDVLSKTYFSLNDNSPEYTVHNAILHFLTCLIRL